MENTNLGLSEEERSIVTNASVILTKNRIIRKVYEIFGEMANECKSLCESLPIPSSQSQPKISKGENLSGLPWVMLDQPRLFTETDIIAIRVLFWWGHFFSITIHAKGIYQQQIASSLQDHLSIFQENGWSIDVGEDPWDHDHDKGTYSPMVGLEPQFLQSMIQDKNYLRISKRYSLDHWDDVLRDLKKDHQLLLTILVQSMGKNRDQING